MLKLLLVDQMASGMKHVSSVNSSVGSKVLNRPYWISGCRAAAAV
jgi:hypothetical protein